MADTQTASLGLTIQTQGGNDNSWGVKANDNFQAIDDKLSATVSKSTTGGTTTLTAEECVAAEIEVTGTLASAAEIDFDGVPGLWFITNGTTGSFDLTVTNGGVDVEIPQGDTLLVFSDGTDFKSAAAIADGSVTLAKLANMAQATVIGRAAAAGTGVPVALTAAQLKTILDLAGSNTGDQTITLTGDVTGSGTSSFAATIAAAAVTLAKMADLAESRIIGRAAGAGTGAPTALTATQATALLDAASDTAKGTIEIAVQSEMEAATDTGRAVVPGRQHYHPGMAKCWAFITYSGGVPTLTASYNITSISDTNTGRCTITIANDFSSADYAFSVTGREGVAGDKGQGAVQAGSQAAGSLVAVYANSAGNYDDPSALSFIGYGDL